jgi:hypothetical protein
VVQEDPPVTLLYQKYPLTFGSKTRFQDFWATLLTLFVARYLRTMHWMANAAL